MLHTQREAVAANHTAVGSTAGSMTASTTQKTRFDQDEFIHRHLGPSESDVTEMLKTIGAASTDELVNETVPAGIRMKRELDLPLARSEASVLSWIRQHAEKNQIYRNFLGLGYYGTHTPTVILRNILENPAWYTAYTPYQAEIAQGRLEALLNFQTMVMELTAMPIANASLLDEATAAAEAMTMLFHDRDNSKKTANVFAVDRHVLPQTLEVLQTRAEPLGLKVELIDTTQPKLTADMFAALVQYPNSLGGLGKPESFISAAHEAGLKVVVAADLLALTLLKPPGEMGADVVVGSTQRFGVPMGFGGPHAAFLATRDEFKRSIPGRIVGVSVDAKNRPALRLALQTREQHIRREKATSNICTAQVLLAVMASMYAVYHGPAGLKQIATRVTRLAGIFAAGVKSLGHGVIDEAFFDTVLVQLHGETSQSCVQRALKLKINLRSVGPHQVAVSFDETHRLEDVEDLWRIFAATPGANEPLDRSPITTSQIEAGVISSRNSQMLRQSEFLKQKVFNSYHSETEMLRYMMRLQSKDLSLAHAMIPLGSCTMKLNATTEMIPVTWPEFGGLHPFAPLDQAQGYLGMIRELESWLSEITGFAGISLQPNAGSQGEYAGLLVIRRYHMQRGQAHRNVCLIPASAHGTNPASAVMAGMKVVVVATDQNGNIDIEDLKTKAEQHSQALAALMITYPSTHGVFEEGVKEICEVIHRHGGQVYMDGANFNALVGLARPGDFGADVCHLNLHKTFCIPHGGGGPGVGPIGVAEHLKSFLPGQEGSTAVSAAPWGSASILPISWSYIALMGRNGLKRATEVAILNANYIAKRLSPHFPVLYTGRNGRVAHECILDLRPLKTSSGIDVEDVAKRLIDYGFHAPTMSWPVAGTLMVEPTESESKEELDRFCDAMISIRREVARVESGEWSRDLNPLKLAPHTAQDLLSDSWDRSYSRETAAFPLPWVRERKFWPAVARVNNPHGDRNLICSCAPLEEYAEKEKS